jgi:small-conductance mechanosensitive channel
MIDALKDVWTYVLATSPSGQTITVGLLSIVLLLLVIGYFGSRLIVFLIGRRLATTKLRPDVIYVVKRIAFFAALVLVVITALGLLGIPLTAFAFASGAIAIGVGFGAQNIINNFISGWILMAERPIRIGDYIELDTAQGTVEEIGYRSTRVRRTDGVHLLVPNSSILQNTVVNWTLVDQEIRTTVRVGVAYGSPVRKVADLISEAVTSQPEVRKTPAPNVIFEDFGDNALVFDAYFWCNVSGDRILRQFRSEIRFRIAELFEKNGIVVAFPQRDVHLDARDPLRIHLIPNHEETAEKDPDLGT